MSALKVDEEVFCREPREAAGGETFRVGVPLLLMTVNCRVSLKEFAS